MTDCKLFEAYVRRRLDQWGREFRLDRDMTPLGHCGKNMLQVAIEHKGEIPPPPTGWKPDVNVTPLGWQTECIVTGVHRESPMLAYVLRAYFAGTGRPGVERYEIAQELSRERFSRRTYYRRLDMALAACLRAFEIESRRMGSVAA